VIEPPNNADRSDLPGSVRDRDRLVFGRGTPPRSANVGVPPDCRIFGMSSEVLGVGTEVVVLDIPICPERLSGTQTRFGMDAGLELALGRGVFMGPKDEDCSTAEELTVRAGAARTAFSASD